MSLPHYSMRILTLAKLALKTRSWHGYSLLRTGSRVLLTKTPSQSSSKRRSLVLGIFGFLAFTGLSSGMQQIAKSSRSCMAGDSGDLVFSDPPYNVDYEGYTDEHLKIQGDRMPDADFAHFLQGAFRSYRNM